MGINAYVYSVEDAGLKERIDKAYEESPWLEGNNSLFRLRNTNVIKDGRGFHGYVKLGRNMQLHRGDGHTTDRGNDLRLDYLLAIMVDGPAMAWANGWHSPNQRLEFESDLQRIGIDKENLSYEGIFKGDADYLIPRK